MKRRNFSVTKLLWTADVTLDHMEIVAGILDT